jgi:hypothetical protein
VARELLRGLAALKRSCVQQIGATSNVWAHWGLAEPEGEVGRQPSRFLADRDQAERAFRLATQLGSINAAARLGTTWPSLCKAFQRHGLGTPAPNPAVVNQRKSDVQLARGGGPQPTAPELHPAFAQLNPGTVPQAAATPARRRCGCAAPKRSRPSALGSWPT